MENAVEKFSFACIAFAGFALLENVIGPDQLAELLQSLTNPFARLLPTHVDVPRALKLSSFAVPVPQVMDKNL